MTVNRTSKLTVDTANLNSGLILPVYDNNPGDGVAGDVVYMNGRLKFHNGNAWYWVGESIYPDPVTSGLVAHFDANKTGGSSGTTWTDHSSIMGSVNIQNRSSDWTFQTDPTTNLVCAYNSTNRTSSPGINIPMASFPKQQGTIEMWLKPIDASGGHGWFVNGDGNSYTNNTNWFWWGEWDNGNCFYHRQGSPSQGCCGNDNSGCVGWSTNVMPRNQWNHIVLTWTTLSPYESKIYVNNSLYQTKGLSSDISSTGVDATGQLFNGHSRGDNMQFKGYCSIYRIYNRVLSASEINTNWTNFRTLHGK